MSDKPTAIGRKSPARLPEDLYGRVRQILESARTSAARSVNTAQVVANWMVGREIVEEEQHGQERAGCAERLVAALSARLGGDYGAGYSAQNLWYMRQFYVVYPELTRENAIRHALRGELPKRQQKRIKAAPKSVPETMSKEADPENQPLNILHAVRGELGSVGAGAASSWVVVDALTASQRGLSMRLRLLAMPGRHGNWNGKSTVFYSSAWQRAETRKV